MTETTKKSRKALTIALAAVCITFAGLLALYQNFRPQPTAGSKNITVEVIYEDSSVQTYMAQTDAEYLEEAIAEMEGLTLEGSRTEQFGLMIDTVNGVRAEYTADNAYWALQLGDTPCNYGVSQQPIQDGEHYKLVYTPAGDS